MEIRHVRDFSLVEIQDIPADVVRRVSEIIDYVKNEGDRALFDLTRKFDGVKLNSLVAERKNSRVIDEDVQAISDAYSSILKVSEAQKNSITGFVLEVTPGVRVRQRIRPLERVGIYVPGGFYPLVSTLLMCGTPAKVAGVKEIYVATPPGKDGIVNPYILHVADLIGVNKVFTVGGAQAIAAFAYGTESIPRVDKIVGPGNIYVNAAKKLVFGTVGIDFVAGPTEILIIADDSADPRTVSYDLLAQAEHDYNARPIIVSTSRSLLEKVIDHIRKILKNEPGEVASKSIEKNGIFLLADSIEEAIRVANEIAPEHLELQIRFPERVIEKLENFGTLFVGYFSAEVLGDYSAGVNHVLPTGGGARYTGGLHVKDFMKIQTILEVQDTGFNRISGTAAKIAEIESLYFHRRSVEVRNE